MATTKQTGPLTDLTAFQRDVLAVIASLNDGEAPHGLGILDRVGSVRDEQVNHGRLYPNLDTLVEKGLVEKSAKDRRTNAYALTSRGRRELAADAKWRAGVLGDAE